MLDRPRVLIIDKDRRTVDQLQEHFIQRGCEAEVALSASVGLSILEKRRMSAAILNAHLGHESNWNLVRRIRASDPKLPLVLFNGANVKGLSREARRAGVTRFLLQPSEIETVLSETMEVVNG